MLTTKKFLHQLVKEKLLNTLQKLYFITANLLSFIESIKIANNYVKSEFTNKSVSPEYVEELISTSLYSNFILAIPVL